MAYFDWSPVEKLARAMRFAWKDGRHLYICGNGGSAANAIHLANDYLYGISKEDGFGMRVTALTANPSVLTCLANDIAYDQIFSAQLKVLANPGDLLLVLSGSGNSPNIVLLNRLAIADVGGYDPELFLFTNELHWSARALLAGWRLVKFDSACVIHRSAPLQRSSRRHAFYYCRNMLLFLLRYAPISQLRPLLTAYTTNIYLYSILHRTTTYLRALRETSMLARNSTRPSKRLTEDQFAQIRPDWRGPFAYLG